MKIATFNINNVNKRLANLLDWLRVAKPDVVCLQELKAADAERRYLEAAVNGVLVASLYAPNGNPRPGPKFKYKLAWMERLAVHSAELSAAGVPVVLAGDYNVVPTDRDIYPTRTRTTRWFSPRAVRFLSAFLTKAGWMPFGRCIPMRRCTRSGTTCGTVGRGTPACALII